ncbi:MAG TPA: TonB-dependent receptor [Burkholderiales bacterium]|nr:TonB-dependent receptor [Burkholderiales bacterium]
MPGEETLKRPITAALIAVAAPLALAQSPEDAIVVTATRLPQAWSQTLQPVKIITAEDIAQSGQQTVVEVLQSLGGVEIASTGGFGQPSSVFMRGANSGHTLVLVDGMRISSATAGTTAFENLPIDQIERIEIVSGQMSGLYGADAIGGVIQIFTKSGKYTPGASVSVGAGSYATHSASAGINGKVDNTDFSLNFGFFETMGLDATKSSLPSGAPNPNNNPDRDGYRNANFSGKVARHLDERNEIGFTALWSDGRTHFDTGPTTGDVNHQTLSAYSVYSRNRIDSVWQSVLKAGQSADDLVVTGAFPGFVRTAQPQLTWQNDVKVGPGTAMVGLEYLAQKVASDTDYTQTHRTIKSAFGGYGGETEQHAWQMNVREDSNSQFGDHTTGSLGYAYRLTSELRLRVGAGTAFKAPTLNDLYFPGFSNPNLRPERSRSKEAGVNYQFGNNRFNATSFDSRITDLIVFVVTDPITFAGMPQNVDQARITGTELSYDGFFGGLRVGAQLVFQNPVDDATGQLLQRRAREHGNLAIDHMSGPWKVGTEIVASSARFDSTNEDPNTRMHGYALVNLTASYALSREWLLRARWNNVFNREYELAQDFNTPGSNVFVALRYQPK